MKGLFYWQDKVGKTNPHIMSATYQITGAGAAAEVPKGLPVLQTYAALTQAQINDFLGTVDEFTAAQFDTTAMGVDSVGFIVNMAGQCKQLVAAEVILFTGAGVTVGAYRQLDTGLTASSLTTQATVGEFGNVAARFIVTGLDAATAGNYFLQLKWISK